MIAHYLQHLHLSCSISPTIENLCLLQRQHVEKIPWENLNIYFKKPISLMAVDIIDKFIRQHRGGICFELNGAYHTLLKNIGYAVKLVQAKIFAFEDKIYQRPRDTHIVNVVQLDDKHYLCDVAWDGHKTPILLPPNNGKLSAECYSIVNQAQHYQFYKKIGSKDILQYQFVLEEISLSAIAHHLDLTNADPEREVAHQLIFKLYTTHGYCLLRDDTIIFLQDRIRTEQSVLSLGGLNTVLVDIFKLNGAAFIALGIS